MQTHSAGELCLKVLQIGEVAVHEIIGDAAILLLYSQVQEDVGLEVVPVSLGGHFHFEPPLQAL
jgi:hypothetical protein